MDAAISVDGLAEFDRAVKELGEALPKVLQAVEDQAADAVLDQARPGVPRRSGRARASLTKQSARGAVTVSGGGPATPYYPWLDFGGRVGRHHSVNRPFVKGGRYLFRGFNDAQDRGELGDALNDALLDAAHHAGIEAR